MGSSINHCCSSKDQIADSLEQTISEHKIFLQIFDKLTDFMQPIIQKSLNPYLESAFLFFDFLNKKLSSQKFTSSDLPTIRKIRLSSQKFLEQLSNEIRIKEEVVHTEKELIIKTLETILNKYYEPFSFTFYGKDTPVLTIFSFDGILNKLSQIHMEIKENEICKEFFPKLNSNISGNFWLKNFKSSTEVPMKEFFASFSRMSSQCYNHELQSNEILLIQSEIDVNNDLTVGIDSWNNFYNKMWSKFKEREILFKRSDNVKNQDKILPKNKLELRCLKGEKNSRQDQFLLIDDNGIFFPNNSNLLSIKKDLSKESVVAGKLPSCEILLEENNKEDKQFQIHVKKVNVRKGIENWFFMNDLGKKHNTRFIINKVGFILTPGMIINVNGHSFKINDLNPISNLYSFDDVYYVDTRPRGCFREIESHLDNNDCFIDLTFFKNGPKQKNFRFKVEDPSDILKIPIGSSENRDIYIEDKEHKFVMKDHCFIVFEPNMKRWIIRDETEPNKTFVFAYGFEEYQNCHKLKREDKYVARGQKLLDGMKILYGDKIIEVKMV